MAVCKLYLVRHGESAANRDGIAGGHLDSPLTEKGRGQVRQTKELFKGIHFDDAYSSDLQQASETAAIIYGKAIPADHQLFDLRERSLGKLEGQPEEKWQNLTLKYEQKYAALPFAERLQYNYADFIENDKSLLARFTKALRQIAKTHAGQTILVATHGGDIRVILMRLGYAQFLPSGSFVNAGYVELTCAGQNFWIQKVVGIDKTARGPG